MPRGDRTGPMGMGMRTGRAAGCRGGEDRPGYMTAGMGHGRGRGFRGSGLGRGYGGWSGRPGRGGWPRDRRYGIETLPHGRPDPEMAQRMLARQAEDLQTQLDVVRMRLEDIDNTPSSS